MTPSNPAEHAVFSVSELLSTLKHGLEMNFPAMWVQGEVSNFLAARSGHWYFSLKDAKGQIRCAWFRFQRGQAPLLRDGQQILVHGRATIYPARGDLQLLVDSVQDAGAGALHLAYEQLKQRLRNEGLFEAARKRDLPTCPRCIGLLTSADGAVIHDVLTTLRRRNPLTRVIVYPIPVQGDGAVARITAMLDRAYRRAECDALLLCRGGGSLEDLQAFNSEEVARRLAASPIPTVAAVGHESDISICDFIADLRAATPTAAAELLSPNQARWRDQLREARSRTAQAQTRVFRQARQNLQVVHQRLNRQSPQRRLQDGAQRLDDLRGRLQRASRSALLRERTRLRSAQRPLRPTLLRDRIIARRHSLATQRRSLQRLRQLTFERARLLQQQLTARLQELSPRRTLRRGYAIAWQDGEALRSAQQLGDAVVEIELADGRFIADPRRSK